MLANSPCKLTEPNGPKPISLEGSKSCTWSIDQPTIDSIQPRTSNQSLVPAIVNHLSVSPIHGSNEPIMAGMSATL